jgi:hypothetical protein
MTTDAESKPREFWIENDENADKYDGERDDEIRPSHINENKFIRVIEYGAYEALRKRCLYLEQNYNESKDNEKVLIKRCDELQKENNLLQIQYAPLVKSSKDDGEYIYSLVERIKALRNNLITCRQQAQLHGRDDDAELINKWLASDDQHEQKEK